MPKQAAQETLLFGRAQSAALHRILLDMDEQTTH
jgi:hypothetical protein